MQTTGDPVLFYLKDEKGKLLGTLSKYIDDINYKGVRSLMDNFRRLESILECKEPRTPPYLFYGSIVDRVDDGYCISQSY